MATKQNCWEFKDCGRQAGGDKVAELGVCAAATEARADGIHDGTNAGRACWAVAGTLCGGEIQGTFASKLHSCLRCDFFQDVMETEGPDLASHSVILTLLD